MDKVSHLVLHIFYVGPLQQVRQVVTQCHLLQLPFRLLCRAQRQISLNQSEDIVQLIHFILIDLSEAARDKLAQGGRIVQQAQLTQLGKLVAYVTKDGGLRPLCFLLMPHYFANRGRLKCGHGVG